MFKDYESLNFKQATITIYRFLTDEISALYATAVKDWLYCDAKNSARRIQTQTTIGIILHELLILLRPILPHTTEEAFQSINNSESIHLQQAWDMKSPAKGDFGKIMKLRAQVLKKLEETSGIDNPLDAGAIVPENEHTKQFLPELADIFGLSRVKLAKSDQMTIVNLQDQPRCERSWRRDSTVTKRENGYILSDRDNDVMNRIVVSTQSV